MVGLFSFYFEPSKRTDVVIYCTFTRLYITLFTMKHKGDVNHKVSLTPTGK